jgi:hypothetical protein
MGEKVGEADWERVRAAAEVSSASSGSSTSSATRALKAPPIIWGMGGGATEDHREKEESLCKGDRTGRGVVGCRGKGQHEGQKRAYLAIAPSAFNYDSLSIHGQSSKNRRRREQSWTSCCGSWVG